MRCGKMKDIRKLTYSEKLTRFRDRLKVPEWRRHFKLILAGKAIAIGLLLLLILVAPAIINAMIGSSSYAQTTAPTTQAAAAAIPPVMPADLSDITKNPTINPINTAWTLVAAF